jgi:Tfp pilus assembly protein PilF
VEIDPKFATVYYNRALYYSKLGENSQAITDLKAAARIGFKEAQDILMANGVGWQK